MRALLLTLATLVTFTSALFVCPPDTCRRVRCAAVTAESCKEGRISKNGGYCGCCDSCVKQLKLGESCSATLLLGSPRTSECGSDLHCDIATRKCMKRSCSDEKQKVQARLDASVAAGRPLLGLELPKCETDGTYSSKQCVGSRCFCSSASGEHITDFSANRWEADSMDCKCARDRHEYLKKGIIGRLFDCDNQGSYREVQCLGSACYCTDENGKQLAAVQSVSIVQKSQLKC